MSSSAAEAARRLHARWQGKPEFVCERVLPAQAERALPWPDWLDGRVRAALSRIGDGAVRPYAHQVAAWRALHAGEDVVVATPTASGKSLCAHAPVLDALVRDEAAHALYLFPTKALARDQVERLRPLAARVADGIGVAVFDGDTPADERRAIRGRARILATNPDMLHASLLPYHDRWATLLGGLRFVVVDELHTYRGVFGAHVANVLRRLRRVAAFHGARPQLCAMSATLANPEELGQRVLGGVRAPAIVLESGAATGDRWFWIYNPPVVDSALGIRKGYLGCAERIIRELLAEGLRTLCFARTRQAVEVLVRTLRDHGVRARGYRAGYLPERRREVERDLREGEASCVVATSALELGIDIGTLDAVVLAGWPGSRAAAWQQAGRAGRRRAPALAVLVASSAPLDQFVASDPEYLFGEPPEHARLDPDNLAILLPHLECAAYELPLERGEQFGPLGGARLGEALGLLGEQGSLLADGDRFHWVGDHHPARRVSLRGGIEENFVVVERATGSVLAEVDARDAPLYLHPSAIYQLEGRTYQVQRLDWEARKAIVDAVAVDHFTDAIEATRLRVLLALEEAPRAAFGEVEVRRRVIGFKKIKYHTHENVGYGEVALPEQELRTRAAWLRLGPVPAPEEARTADAALGAAYALHHAAALLLLCEPGDLGRVVAGEPGALGAAPSPVVTLYDAYPGGTGLCERVFEARSAVVARARARVAACDCRRGCPACVGAGRRERDRAAAMLAELEAALAAAPRRVAS